MINDIKHGDIFKFSDGYILACKQHLSNDSRLLIFAFRKNHIEYVSNPSVKSGIISAIEFLNEYYQNIELIKNITNTKEIFEKFLNSGDESGLY